MIATALPNRNAPAMAAGVLLLLLSIVANVWVIERVASPDGRFDPDTRAVLLAVNLAAAGLGAWIVWRRGDALPVRWGTRFVIRSPLVAVVLVAAISVCAVVSAVELVFYNLNERRTQLVVRYDGGEIHLYDPYLGYKPVANLTTTGTMTFGGAHAYTATYSFDEFSRRITPDPYPDTPRDEAVLVFGGSFAFGSGVEDDETFAYRLAELLPDARVYNYAYGGWGVQHMLALLEQEGFANQVAERHARVIYLYIPAHIGRTTGSLRNVTTFGRHFPAYAFDSDTGRVERVGVFEQAYPWRMKTYDWLAREQTAKYFHLDFPPVGPRQLGHTAAVFAEARRVFESKFGSTGFDVVIFPEHPNNTSRANAIVPALNEVGVRAFDYSGLFDTRADGYLIPYDLHPAPRAHQALAEAVVDNLLDARTDMNKP